MLVIIPVCSKDVAIAMQNLAWLKHLNQNPSFDAIISCESEFDVSFVAEAASPLFSRIEVFRYDKWEGDRTWPQPQNHAWQSIARRVSTLGRSWFWWEADATPLKVDWLEQILAAHIAGGKPFSGPIVRNNGYTYMAGVGVYPANIARYSIAAFLCRAGAFDVVLGQDIISSQNVTDLKHLIHHETIATRFRGFDMAIRPEIVLFHKCKDGSIIESLSGGALTGIPSAVLEDFKIEPAWKLSDHTLEPLEIFENYPSPIKRTGPRIIHCVERHKQKNEDAYRRVMFAVKSWLAIYETGLMVPAHYWKYRRSSTAIGDARGLPFLKDVLAAGLERSRHKRDIIMLTNDDTVLHSETGNALMEFMKDKQAACSGRVNYEFMTGPDFTRQYHDDLYKKDIGRDLFAFRRKFLEKHFDSIPDFILGELEWDLVLCAFIRKKVAKKNTTISSRETREPLVELPMGYVFHENHKKRWQFPDYASSPAKKHNANLMTEWCVNNGMDELITI